ncbi:MAG: phosphoglycerate kinase [Clostridiales bacterium]|jgi:phosphoglycerate kinase|nr:phosphoglycerate kinase [Clostridiales bacterium]
MNKKTIDDVDLFGKKVLVRCDFNVPLNDNGKEISDEQRIISSIPTIKKLMEIGARIILCSHLGKPKGEAKPELSLGLIAKKISEHLNKPLMFADDDNVTGKNTKNIANSLENSDIMLLQNTRFRKEETKNEENFSKELAALTDGFFVNDAFGSSHRAHCSTVGVTEYMETSVAGYLIEKELKFLGNAINNPERPFCAILGGAKVSDKINVINNLLEKVDTLIIGGGMAYTFLKAQGFETGKSLLEEDKIDFAKEMIKKSKAKNVKLLVPIDTIIADDFSNDANFKTVNSNKILPDWEGLDIGEKTIKLFSSELENAKTVIWNGPMGAFEMSNFARGTNEIAKFLSKIDAVTIIGGGDSAFAVNQTGLADKMTHISTGGGASLEFLEGKELPGIKVLDDKK